MKKKIIFFSIIFFTLCYLIITKKVSANDNVSQIIRNYTEKIYEYISCHDGYCDHDYPNSIEESKELFAFYGYDSNCDYFKPSCDITYTCSNKEDCIFKSNQCKKENNNKECVNCTGLNFYECEEKKEECIHNETYKCYLAFPNGQSGTIKAENRVFTNGQRTYIDGYDNSGFHWFRTNTHNPGGQSFALKENTKNVYFNGHLLQTDLNSDIFLNTDKNQFSKIIWEKEKEKYKKSNEYIQATETETGQTFINFHSEEENIMEMNSTGSYASKLHNGAEVNSLLETNGITWKGNTGKYRKLHWTPIQQEFNSCTQETDTFLFGMRDGYPNPSKENTQILFYYDSQ